MMSRLTKNTLVSIVILLFLGMLFAASYAIPETHYNSIQANVWPRLVILFTGIWTAVYLVQSVQETGAPVVGASGGFRAFLTKYRNPLACFAMFGAFVALLPYVGIIVAGILFVFSTLSFIGSRRPRMLALYGVIAVVTVVGFWAIFTFFLGVMLPEGEWFGRA